MKNFYFILSGMILLVYLLGSCSDSQIPEPENNTEETNQQEENLYQYEDDEDDYEEHYGEHYGEHHENHYEDHYHEQEEEEDQDEEDEDQEYPPEASSQGEEEETAAQSPAPVFLECRAVSEREVIFEFSLPVSIISLCFFPEHEIESIEEGDAVKVTLAENIPIGLNVTADITAMDEYGNLLEVTAQFKGRNTRVPLMLINELFTEYDKGSSRTEYIEFKMLSAGNMGAIRVYAASNYKQPLIYEFAPVDVNEGEYVVLHLRMLEDTNRDEYGENLEESGGTFASPAARDFWKPGSEKYLRQTDIVYVLDQDDEALDAVMIAESSDPVWKLVSRNNCFPAHAEFLHSKDAWRSADGSLPTQADAASSATIKTSVTKSISRKESAKNTRSAADWYVTAQNGASPGGPNKP
ncbi:MAG: hypothetical protein LBH16_05035 [Treponema sp.]|jgi:hypothetical protein|nr:hypothetical protein [Treponema sp.]